MQMQISISTDLQNTCADPEDSVKGGGGGGSSLFITEGHKDHAPSKGVRTTIFKETYSHLDPLPPS